MNLAKTGAFQNLKLVKQQKSGFVKSQSLAAVSNLRSKQHKDCRRSSQDVTRDISKEKRNVNLVVIGHVDAGKSTLIGHLLVLLNKIDKNTMKKIEEESALLGKSEDSFAWVMAQDATERERGVTIDVSSTEFETHHLKITVLDAPGHRDFVPNMIAGASQADTAFLVVDVTDPLVQAGQVGEHVFLCRSLGISSFIIAINKMDRANFSEEQYNSVKIKLDQLLKTFGSVTSYFIPTSSVDGENLIVKSKKMDWYTGLTVIDALDQIIPPKVDIEQKFVLCVSDFKEKSRSVIMSGKVESGYVCQNDRIKFLPSGLFFKVSSVSIQGRTVNYGYAGQIISLTLSGDSIQNLRPVGSALLDPEKTLLCSKIFTARVNTSEMENPILNGSRLVYHCHSIDIPVRVIEVKAKVNRQTKQIEVRNPGFVTKRSCADIVFEFEEIEHGIVLDLFDNSHTFGSFILRDHGITIGYGRITSI